MTREATAIYLGPVLSLVVLLTFQAIAGEAQPGGVSYRGVVVIEASGQPVANAQIKAFKYRKPWLLPVPPALRLMGEGRSDSEGRFGFGALNYATKLRVATDDRTYYAKIKARPKRRDRDFVVRLKPAVSISYYRASDHWKIATPPTRRREDH